MNKKFLQSVTAGIVGLGLLASCAQLGLKKDSNTCGAKNGCAAKKDEANKCSAKKDEVKKEEVKKSEKKAKKSKKSKKAAKEVKVEKAADKVDGVKIELKEEKKSN